MSSSLGRNVEILDLNHLPVDQMSSGEIAWLKSLQGADPFLGTGSFQLLEPDQQISVPESAGVNIFGCNSSPFSIAPVLVCFDPSEVNFTQQLELTTSGKIRSAYRIDLKSGRVGVLVFVREGWEYQFSLVS